jgi:D-beta-D-heptose 7-phosphate kinase / D-beta-D-heptose 1-phosphate adenosyltransferase
LAESQAIINYAREHQIKVIVDPKSKDFSVYSGAHILTPNMSEFEAAVGHCETTADIERKGLQLVHELNLDALLVTRGSQGMTLIEKNASVLHIPAQAKEVFDITGAGDTVIAVLSACIAANVNLKDAARLANLAAGIVVGRLGTATISLQDLEKEITQQKSPNLLKGVMNLPALMAEVTRRKNNGEKVVMTNGCFDILHAGHITYLQQARELGDCLIMAVNDDASVQRLKGKTRPVNPLDARMQTLAALRCVDYVIPFSEDTPRDLIAAVLPDILVKGGDYTVEQIAGAKEVLANGGDVKILPFVPGFSTTRTLEKLALPEEEVL